MYRLLGPLACLALAWFFTWAPSGRCRCRPWETCWPSVADWSALNESMQGNLIRIRPVASVCHGSEYEAAACANVSNMVVDSGWRASNPRTLQDWIWETGNTAQESCFDTTWPGYHHRTSDCHQGRIPLYSAIVESTSDIQSCVKFANHHNLRLVIKNSGHDTAGRSSAPHSFQISTSSLKTISLHENFVPRGSTTGHGPAVTLGAGVMQWEVYAHGVKNAYTILGGECPTVGAVGAFLQGGGVSSIKSFTKGLAVDNVLEFQVVTSNADLVTANENENQDLFWALRGGGGGTFGFVAQATIRVFPDDPVTVATTTIKAAVTNTMFWTEGVRELFRLVQHFNDMHIPGQLVMTRPTTDSMQATLELHFANTTDEAHVTRLLNSQLRPLTLHHISTSTLVRVQERESSELRTKPDIYPPHYGIVAGSVLISAATLRKAQGQSHVASKLSQLPLGSNDIMFTSNLGGRVFENSAIDISLHPAWREAAHLITLVRAVEPTIEDRDSQVSYRNLGDPQEKEFRDRYWGTANYARLAAIKAKWDPHELFMSKLGVGSENWDEEGICRKSLGFVERLSAILKLERWKN
uniref:FAD-linked oxidoreductase easE n=1 Tax=Claviceps fusiformis TaxID=40602 RepID=EASE_CLAFS|nr:RecName: Full=FAD-linked oxidoreductase easE; AltName: Full=Chanoclavine I synthase; AltName: Full=Ergot alkaloid synthesis protein E; Flags: Precursor [Claviceps fusiformis]ABV57823.1 oxidoreductase [Claviceps fusiformis]